jgi:uncharacterized protein (DUF1800 family)
MSTTTVKTTAVRTTTRLDRPAAVHLLRRLCFGAPVQDVDRFVGETAADTIEQLVEGARSTEPDPAITLLLPTGELGYVQSWWCEQMLGTPEGRCAERVALMWHGHFATSNDKVDDVHLMHGQYRLWRERGLGDFRQLLQAALRDPALLVWLDGVDNVKGRPNENLARELMELFALGIGNYTEADVLEAARGLSGWRVVKRAARFTPSRHDAGAKTVLGTTGELDTNGVVAAVLARPACPRWIADRLWRTFVGRAPSAGDIETTAAELAAANWDIGRTLVWLATRPEFLAAEERATRIAGPVELVVRATLETGARLAPKELAESAARMGQALLRPPSVKGWDGGRQWLDSTAWIARQRFAGRVAEVLEDAGDFDPFERLLPEEPHPSWRAAVERIAAESEAPRRTLVAAVLASAEYQLQ